MKISVNGQIVEQHAAVVSAFDHGFLYGIGVFETFRTYDGEPFMLEAHLERLHDSLGQLGIRYHVQSSEVRTLIHRLLEVNRLEDAYIRYTVSAGAGQLGLAEQDYERPTVIVYVKPLVRREEWYEFGRTVQILQTVRPLPETKRRLKSFSYMNGWFAKRELLSYKWAAGAEGIQLNERGELTEAIVSNVFWVTKGKLYTPALESGALPGVARGFVLQLAEQLNIEAEEGLYCAKALWEADEIFLTNSVQEIVPVSKVYDTDGTSRTLSGSIPGAVTHQLMRGYSEACRRSRI